MDNLLDAKHVSAEAIEAGKWSFDDELMDRLVERWAEKTAQVEEETLRLPMATLLGEAVDLAAVVESRYATVTVDGITTPGLETVAATGMVSAATPEHLRELALSIGAVNSRIRAIVEDAGKNSVEEAESALDALRATLTFVLEGSSEKADEQLARLAEDHGNAESHDAMALALQAYAELADDYKDALSQITTYDPALAAEARGLAHALRQRSADRLVGATVTATRSALSLRNRLIGALADKMRDARKAVRFVFRKDPDVIRAASSSYERARRRRYRTSAKGAESNDPADTTALPATATTPSGTQA